LLPVFDEHGRHAAPVADWSMTVDDPARQTELRIVLGAAIAELPADYRVVELLRDVDGLSHREIAETLGLTAAAVRMRVHRARLFLRKRLGAHLSSAGLERTPSVAGSATARSWSRPPVSRSRNDLASCARMTWSLRWRASGANPKGGATAG